MKVSIITVCHNSSRFIRQTIEAVLAQDYADFEYVIVDGGSTDGTVDLIQKYAAQDPRIIWCTETDRGISDAMNKGVAMSSGEIVAHLNSDDYYTGPTVVSAVVKVFTSKPSALWVTAGLNFISETGDELQQVRVRRYSQTRLLRGNIILHPATFIKRDAFISVGSLEESLRYCMDYDLFLRLAQLSDPETLDEQLTCFRVHDESLSVVNSDQAYAEEFQVRQAFLRKAGRSVWPFFLDYQIKRRLNRLFYRSLRTKSRNR